MMNQIPIILPKPKPVQKPTNSHYYHQNSSNQRHHEYHNQQTHNNHYQHHYQHQQSDIKQTLLTDLDDLDDCNDNVANYKDQLPSSNVSLNHGHLISPALNKNRSQFLNSTQSTASSSRKPPVGGVPLLMRDLSMNTSTSIRNSNRENPNDNDPIYPAPPSPFKNREMPPSHLQTTPQKSMRNDADNADDDNDAHENTKTSSGARAADISINLVTIDKTIDKSTNHIDDINSTLNKVQAFQNNFFVNYATSSDQKSPDKRAAASKSALCNSSKLYREKSFSKGIKPTVRQESDASTLTNSSAYGDPLGRDMKTQIQFFDHEIKRTSGKFKQPPLYDGKNPPINSFLKESAKRNVKNIHKAEKEVQKEEEINSWKGTEIDRNSFSSSSSSSAAESQPNAQSSTLTNGSTYSSEITSTHSPRRSFIKSSISTLATDNLSYDKKSFRNTKKMPNAVFEGYSTFKPILSNSNRTDYDDSSSSSEHINFHSNTNFDTNSALSSDVNSSISTIAKVFDNNPQSQVKTPYIRSNLDQIVEEYQQNGSHNQSFDYMLDEVSGTLKKLWNEKSQHRRVSSQSAAPANTRKLSMNQTVHANEVASFKLPDEYDANSLFNVEVSESDLRTNLHPGLKKSSKYLPLSAKESPAINQQMTAGSYSSGQNLPVYQRQQSGNSLFMNNEVSKLARNRQQSSLRFVRQRTDIEEQPKPPMNPPPKPFPTGLSKFTILGTNMPIIDRCVNEVAQTDPITFTDLTFQLCKNSRTDVERVRALFRWITVFDLSQYDFDANAHPDSLIGMLRRIKSSQITHNELFHQLCRYAGIHCQFISGYSKDAGYRPGMALRDNRMFRNTWTAVYVGGGWRFVNCNWGSRYLASAHLSSENRQRNGTLSSIYDVHYSAESPELQYRCDEFYFLTDAHEHIYEHFPDNKKWQLLHRPISLEQFMKLPILKSPFFNNDLSLKKKYSETLTTKNGVARLRLKMSPSRFVYVSCTLENRSDNSLMHGMTMIQLLPDNEVLVTAAPCQPGKFYLNVFVNENWSHPQKSVATQSQELVLPSSGPNNSNEQCELACSFQVHCAENNLDRLVLGRAPEVGMLGKTPFSARYGICMLNENPYIVWEKKEAMRLPIGIYPASPVGVRVLHRFFSYERGSGQCVNCSSYALLQHSAVNKGHSYFQLHMPISAYYLLVIYAGTDEEFLASGGPGIGGGGERESANSLGGTSSEETDRLQCVYRLLIDCRKSGGDAVRPFPRCTSRWHGFIRQPLDQHVELNRRVKFEIEAPLCSQVSVVINGSVWQDLSQKKPGVWCGKVNSGQELGELSVYGIISGAVSQRRPTNVSAFELDTRVDDDYDDHQEEFTKLLDYALVQKGVDA